MSRQGSFVKSLTPQHGHKTTFLVIRININQSLKKKFSDYEDFGNYCHDFCDQKGKCITHCVDPFDAESDEYEITSDCEGE